MITNNGEVENGVASFFHRVIVWPQDGGDKELWNVERTPSQKLVVVVVSVVVGQNREQSHVSRVQTSFVCMEQGRQVLDPDLGGFEADRIE